jgi:hypothetical protein
MQPLTPSSLAVVLSSPTALAVYAALAKNVQMVIIAVIRVPSKELPDAAVGDDEVNRYFV